MNPLELLFDSSEVGDMVGTCVGLAPSAHAGPSLEQSLRSSSVQSVVHLLAMSSPSR